MLPVVTLESFNKMRQESLGSKEMRGKVQCELLLLGYLVNISKQAAKAAINSRIQEESSPFLPFPTLFARFLVPFNRPQDVKGNEL